MKLPKGEWKILCPKFKQIFGQARAAMISVYEIIYIQVSGLRSHFSSQHVFFKEHEIRYPTGISFAFSSSSSTPTSAEQMPGTNHLTNSSTSKILFCVIPNYCSPYPFHQDSFLVKAVIITFKPDCVSSVIVILCTLVLCSYHCSVLCLTLLRCQRKDQYLFVLFATQLCILFGTKQIHMMTLVFFLSLKFIDVFNFISFDHLNI